MTKPEIKQVIEELIKKIIQNDGGILVNEDQEVGGIKNWFSIEISNATPFLKNEGEALASFNHLVKKIVETNILKAGTTNEEATNFLIDINGFQKKRIENLRALAHMMAERARYFKANIEVDPMSAFERRVVHEFLSNATDLKTESEGFGKNRRVVIKYIGEI